MGQQLAYLRHNENNFSLKILKFMVPEAVLNGCDYHINVQALISLLLKTVATR